MREMKTLTVGTKTFETVDGQARTQLASTASDLAVQTARIDEIASLPEGSTSGDAELADIRVGYNGVTYPNAGDAVRSQIADVNNLVGDPIDTGYYSEITNLSYLTGGGQGSVGDTISFSSSTSYSHIVLDCSVNKYWNITTRRSNSANYPVYVFETNSNNEILKVYDGKSSSSYDWHTYEFKAGNDSTRIYVTVYRGSGASTAEIIPKYIPDLSTIIGDQNTFLGDVQEVLNLQNVDLENQLNTEAKQKVMNLNRDSGTKCLNFVFCTDLHVNGYGALVTYAQPSINLFKQACNDKFADFGAFGGDMYSDYNLSHDEAIAAIEHPLAAFGEINIPLLITKGNHECNGKYVPLWTGGTPAWGTYHYYVLNASGRSYDEVTESTWDGETPLHYSTGTSTGYDSNTMFSKADTLQDWENCILSQTRAKTYAHFYDSDPYGDYYYVDFEEEKIRVVVLNGFNSSTTCDGLEQQVLSANQLSWIENEVLSFTDPTDWHVLFITHMFPSENNGAEFYALLNTFITNGGNVLGILHGHEHADTYYTHIGSYSWLINIIGVSAGFTADESALRTRNAYGVSVFTIDKVNSKIYETKMGKGSDREFTFVPTQSINI